MIKSLIITGILSFSIVSIVNAEGPKVIHYKGKGKVQLIQYENGQWQMLLDGKPYFIKGVVYEPVKVGNRLVDSNMWMNYDFNHSGKPDTAYDSWVDKNYNNLQDADEPPVGDFQLLKEMGCNTIRPVSYTHLTLPTKRIV